MHFRLRSIRFWSSSTRSIVRKQIGPEFGKRHLVPSKTPVHFFWQFLATPAAVFFYRYLTGLSIDRPEMWFQSRLPQHLPEAYMNVMQLVSVKLELLYCRNLINLLGGDFYCNIAELQVVANFNPVLHTLLQFQLNLPNPKHFQASSG